MRIADGYVLLAQVPAGPRRYDPNDARENMLEYFGVFLAFVLAAFVIWFVIRKDLREDRQRRHRGEG